MNELPNRIRHSRMVDDSDYEYLDLPSLTQALLKRWWMLLLSGCIAAFGTLLFTLLFLSPTYQSGFTAYVNNSTQTPSSNIVTASDITASRQLTQTYAEIIHCQPVMDLTVEKSGLDISSADLSSRVTVSSLNATELISISVTASSPEEAYCLACALQETAPQYAEQILIGSSIKIVQRSVLPTSPSGPNLNRVLRKAFLLGAVLCCAVLLLSELLDDRVKSAEMIEKHFPVLVLGTIHDLDSSEESVSYEQRYKEDYQSLRTNLMFSFADSAPKVIALTGSIRHESSMIHSFHLAIACAELDKKVLLIDCNMRLPSIAQNNSIHTNDQKGLSDLLIGAAAFQDVVTKNDTHPISILTTGTIPPDATRLLHSPAMRAFIKSMKEQYDYIILDCPPVNAVVDALLMADFVDGYLLSAKHKEVNRKELSDSLKKLRRSNANLLGVVYTHAPTEKKSTCRRRNRYDCKQKRKY